ncbi:endonuclease [Amycolatopsis antarctica]|uniref:Endonuclease n=2 Tax=Amycolatopsis antarctica TaxID=1854586 RepID=A0A263CY03_9PSEU|nr:endonuclease [Amycolatopsis antarctica]
MSRRWLIAAGTLLLVAGLGLGLLPRYLGDEQPAADGPALRVLTVNMYFGGADPRTIVDLVRTRAVEVLSLQEVTPEALRAMEAAGLASLLPHRVLRAEPGASGSGLLSVHPLTELDLAGPSTLAQPSARLTMPDGSSAELVAVHPMPPVEEFAAWRSELAGLPRPAAPVRILAGDFNATLDHTAFRELIGSGYADTAEELGRGFLPTWPSGNFPPPVTIDHVLVDRRVAVRDHQVFHVPGGDHRAVYAELTLPRRK